MNTDKFDHIRLEIPYIEYCAECGGQKVTTHHLGHMDTSENHKPKCSILLALQKRYNPNHHDN